MSRNDVPRHQFVHPVNNRKYCLQMMKDFNMVYGPLEQLYFLSIECDEVLYNTLANSISFFKKYNIESRTMKKGIVKSTM